MYNGHTALCFAFFSGCVGADPCGLLPPYSSPALPVAPPPPAAIPYTGFPPPQVPYGPQGYAQPPPMAPNGFGMHDINTLAQNTAKDTAKLLGGIHPEKKFVPHLPRMGFPQQGKPPYNPPPPPPPEPQAGFAPALPGQLPYQQPFNFGQQGIPPQTAGFGPQPAPGFAQPVAPPMQGSFADQQAFTVSVVVMHLKEKP